VKTAEIHDNAIARDVKETLRKLQAAPVRRQQPGPGLPGQVAGRRQDAHPVAGPRRQDLTARSHHPPPPARCGGVVLPTPEFAVLDDTLKTQLAAYLQRLTETVDVVATLDDREASREMRDCSTRSRR